VQKASSATIASIEQAIEEMPMISPIVNKLAEMAHDLQASSNELVKIIMIDPVLTAKVIKLVNSAFYGLPEQVQSLGQAVLLLGVNTVKNLAMCTAVLDKVVVRGKLPLEPEIFWRHCLATAVACRMLAKVQGVAPNERERYFLAGLLHDVGKVVLMKALAEKYQHALEESRLFGVSLYFSELAHFGFSHTDTGALLARKWKLDASLVEVIECHHRYDALKSQNHVMKIVVVANNLCKRSKIGAGGNPVVEEWMDDLAEKLKIDPAAFPPIMDQLPAELEKAVQFLKMSKESRT
jgi:putative nucleotidyltransferase with HDIG domain